MTWVAVLAGVAGCYALKLAGLSVPAKLIAQPRVRHVAALLPVALLATLVVLQGFSTGQRIVVDARALGVGVALVAVILRAPFIVVVVAAVLATALLRLAVH